jgi:hypothetical protein
MVIYLDSSIVLAQIFAEDRAPPETLGQGALTSSRLLEYEVWNRVHARGYSQSHGDATERFLRRVSLIDLSPEALARSLHPFPLAVRTLDGLHLATAEFLRTSGEDVELASYDRRLIAAARALGIAIHPLSEG